MAFTDTVTNVALGADFTKGSTGPNIGWNVRTNFIYPLQTGDNKAFGAFQDPAGRLFWVTAQRDNSNGQVEITSPWSEGPTSIVGQSNIAFYPDHTNIAITATPTYPNTFLGWYTALTGGTLIQSGQALLYTWNDTYISNTTIYARFSS